MVDIDVLLSRLTLEDKINLLSGKGLWRTAQISHCGIQGLVMTDGTYGVRYSSAQIDKGENWAFDDFISIVNQSAKLEQSIGENESVLVSEPSKGGSEALFGRTKPATCFPNGSSLACSWDIELIYAMGEALGDECLALNVDLLLGPGINIRRTPLAGRGYEYYSEDPILTSEIASALINGIQSKGVGASLKHYACNNSEFRRTQMNSVVNKRALYEIYLLGFLRTIQKSNPMTIMSSYNRVNGEQVNESHFLLTEVLREQFGFKGVILSDWYGIKNRAQSLKAGNDLDMPEIKRNKEELKSAIDSGEIAIDELDRSCRRMLTLLLKLGKIDLQVLNELESSQIEGRQINEEEKTINHVNVNFLEHHHLAANIAAASIVLLKNDDKVLPLTPEKYKKVAVIGKWAHEPVIQGSGCATTIPYYVDRPLDELMSLSAEEYDFEFALGAPFNTSVDAEKMQQAIELAAQSDIVLLFVNTAIGEDGENGDRANLELLPSHQILLEEIAKVQSHCVVILANADAVVMPWIDKVPAVLETFFSGQGVGSAVAKILLGHINPSGKLTTTLPKTLEETPSYLYYPGELHDHFYSEGIFVGYRYYEKRKLKPLFPFGFGLSYSQFDYQAMVLSKKEIKIQQLKNLKDVDNLTVVLEISVHVKNCGPFDGHETVQLYLSHPSQSLQSTFKLDDYPREVKSLKAFSKQYILNQEIKTYYLTLTAQDFAYYHTTLDRFVIDSGDYIIRVGASSHDIKLEQNIKVITDHYLVPLAIDCSLVELIEQPVLFQNVIDLIKQHSSQPEGFIKEKLISMAPDLFCGLYMALTEFFQLDISKEALFQALNPEKQEIC